MSLSYIPISLVVKMKNEMKNLLLGFYSEKRPSIIIMRSFVHIEATANKPYMCSVKRVPY